MKNKNNLMSSQSDCIFYFLNDEEYKIKKRKPIHKITTFDFFVRNELTNVDKIKKILDYKKYYYVCENSSELKITNFEDDIRSGKEIKSDETVLMKFEDRQLIYLKDYLKALSSFTKYIFTLIDFYKHLLNSITLLIDKQIVHNNINFDAIVVDNHFHPLLSNFSFSIDISCPNIDQHIKHFFIAYEPSYLEWPLEFHIISYLLTNKLDSLSNHNIETVIHDVIENNNILKTFGDSLVSSYKEEALKYFKKYVNRSYEYILTDILQYSNTWDNYTLSILLLRILISIHRSINKKNKFIILFMKLLVSNIHLNPLKRFSISLTTNKFNNLLDNLEPKDYKEVINGLMSA
jgi:hypothetical protein